MQNDENGSSDKRKKRPKRRKRRNDFQRADGEHILHYPATRPNKNLNAHFVGSGVLYVRRDDLVRPTLLLIR